MQPQEQQTRSDDAELSISELEALAEQEAAEAEARARAAEVAREKLAAARLARRAEQLEPLRARQRELAAQLAVIDAQVQAGITASLAEARSLYREARDLYRERVTVTNSMLALGAASFGERVPVFERFVMRALARFRDTTPGWEAFDA